MIADMVLKIAGDIT